MDRKYKPLLPALRTPPGRSEPGEQSPSATKRKRMYVKTACDICRIKKTACDGQRPACTPCAKRKSACTFSGRPAGSDEARSPGVGNINNDPDSVNIITALLMAHDAEAHELLDRVRQGRGTVEVLGPWSEGEEEVGKDPIMLPPDQTSFEFELMTKHPVAYPALVPLDSHNQGIFPDDRLQVVQCPGMEVERDAVIDGESSEAPCFGLLGIRDFEERLRHVHFARWTNVSISGSEAASAIAHYLAHEHVILQLFDAELFLKDVVHDYGNFCSSLLINALLGWCLPGIASTNSEGRDPAGAAYETALRQLDALDDRLASLSTLAAIELLSLTALFRGEGTRSNSLLRQAINVAQRLNLLSRFHDDSNHEKGPVPANEENVSNAIASWGLFSMATILSFYYQRQELDPSLLPSYTLPDVEVRHSINAVLPKHFGGLWAIMHKINSQYYREANNSSNELDTSFIRSMLVRLLRWADDLPVILARGNRSTQEVMLLHVFFHAAVMTLTHPLALRRDIAPLLDGESPNRSAESIYLASAAQMHRLVDIHRFQSRITTSSIFWHAALLFSANASIRSSSSADSIRRWHFLRVMDAYADFRSRYPVVESIFRGLMTMAVETGLLGSQEAVKLARALAVKGARLGSTREKLTKAYLIVDLELALVDRGMALVDVLSKRFDEIVMFDDFTYEDRDP